MFTQLNQYRVVLEVKPDFRQNIEDSETSTCVVQVAAKWCRSVR
jgi:hypothetical protein